MFTYIFVNHYPPRKNEGSALLAIVVVLAITSSLMGLSTAKISQASMSGTKASKITTEAQNLAQSDADLLRAIAYSDLSNTNRQRIADTTFEHEIIVSSEEKYSDTIKQKKVGIKVYNGSETIPRSTINLTRYSVENKASGVPIGTIIAWASTKNPQDGTWLDCNGQSCASFSELTAILGKSTVPDYRNRFLEGSATPNTVIQAGLPNIMGKASFGYYEGNKLPVIYSSGAFAVGSRYLLEGYLTSNGKWNTQPFDLVLDASLSNSIYGKSTTVQPPATTVRYLIKAA